MIASCAMKCCKHFNSRQPICTREWGNAHTVDRYLLPAPLARVLAVLCLSVLLVVVSNMALNVALPTLGRELHASTTSLAWIVDIYVLCFAGLLLPAGAISDHFGRKGTLQTGLLIFMVAASLAALSVATWQLIVSSEPLWVSVRRW
jgi:MFS family permease